MQDDFEGLQDFDDAVSEEAEGLYEHFRVVADKGQELLRVDKFLMYHLPNTSRNRIQQAATAGFIHVNDKPVKSNYRVKPHDVVTMLLDRPRYDSTIVPEDIPLDIVYEDEALMDGALTLLQALYVVQLQLVAEVVDPFLEGLHPGGGVDVPLGEGGEGQPHDLGHGPVRHIQLMFRLVGKNDLFLVHFLRAAGDVQGMVGDAFEIGQGVQIGGNVPVLPLRQFPSGQLHKIAAQGVPHPGPGGDQYAMIRIIVVDDEFPTRQELASLLLNIKDVEIVAECSLGQEALDFLQKDTADLIYLDIEMPQINGIETAKIIKSTIKNPPEIIFSTGFDQFAVTAFELHALDYILKPYTQERILASIMRFRNLQKQLSEKQASSGDLKFPIWHNDKMILLNAESEISLIKSEQQRILVFSDKGIFEINTPLKELEQKLKGHGFLRTHKCYIVNINKVREVIPWFNDTFVLMLENCSQKDIPVSRHYIQEFKKYVNL